MHSVGEVNQNLLNDAELVAIVRENQRAIEEHGQLNEPKALLAQFALELLKRRILAKVKFAKSTELHPPEQLPASSIAIQENRADGAGGLHDHPTSSD